MTFFPSCLQASLLTHCIIQYTAQKNKRERGEVGILTHRQQWIPHSLSTHTHQSQPSATQQLLCLTHNYSHSTTTHSPGSAVQSPMRNRSETTRNRNWEGHEAVSTAGDAWARPWAMSLKLISLQYQSWIAGIIWFIILIQDSRINNVNCERELLDICMHKLKQSKHRFKDYYFKKLSM